MDTNALPPIHRLTGLKPPDASPLGFDGLRAWPSGWAGWGLLAMALAGSTPAIGQPREASSTIYVCTDESGRRLTSDRPIPECANREQREITPAGTVRRVIAPPLSAPEQARLQQQAEAEAAQKAREKELRRRDHALLARYPSQRQHDLERSKQLALVDEAAAVIERRRVELQRQEKEIRAELEFYKADPAQAPGWLTRKLADNTDAQRRQHTLLEQQNDERRRIHARFDDELARLKQLWAASPAGGAR